MTSRLETTGGNVRRIAARIFPEMASERFAPRTVTDLFTDPLDLASALFACRLADTAATAVDEPPVTHVNGLPPLELSGDVGRRTTPARDFLPASSRATEPSQFTRNAAHPQPSRIAKAFVPAQVTDGGRSPQRSMATALRGKSPSGALTEHTSEQSGANTIRSDQPAVEHAPRTVSLSPTRSPRQEPGDRQAPSAPAALTNNRLAAIAPAAVRRSISEAAPEQPGTFTRGAAFDEGVTRWVKGAAGLATLFAPSKPAVGATSPAMPPAAVPPLPVSHPDLELENAATTPVAVPTSPVSAAHAASSDVELLMDELERRLELEYLRHYGTSGR